MGREQAAKRSGKRVTTRSEAGPVGGAFGREAPDAKRPRTATSTRAPSLPPPSRGPRRGQRAA